MDENTPLIYLNILVYSDGAAQMYAIGPCVCIIHVHLHLYLNRLNLLYKLLNR